MLVLITIAAWLTLLIPMPRWLGGIVTFLVIGFGLIFAITGGMAWYWDSHMQPDAGGGFIAFACGVLMLLSRARHVLRLIAEILASTH